MKTGSLRNSQVGSLGDTTGVPQHHSDCDYSPKRACLSFGAIGLILALLTSPAYPWGSKGHEIVPAIAETQLTDTARKRIKELLRQGTTLADASTWPDKAGRQIPDMDPYHYINFPKDANTYDQ